MTSMTESVIVRGALNRASLMDVVSGINRNLEIKAKDFDCAVGYDVMEVLRKEFMAVKHPSKMRFKFILIPIPNRYKEVDASKEPIPTDVYVSMDEGRSYRMNPEWCFESPWEMAALYWALSGKDFVLPIFFRRSESHKEKS